MKINTFIALLLFLGLKSVAQLQPISYFDNQQKLTGFLSHPKKKIKSTVSVLILPAWMGVDAHAKESAIDLSYLGYNSFVADIYGDGNNPANSAEAGQKSGFYKKNSTEYHKRIQLALNEFIKQGADPNNIVVIGYCFGGTGAIETARAGMNVKGIVSFHGGLGRDDKKTIETIKAKVLILHGADDPYVSEAEIKLFQNEMRTAKADWQMNYYANAVHAFTDKNAGTDNSKGAAYNEIAEKRSWIALLTFLKEF